MATDSLFDALGLPGIDDAARARARMRERGATLIEQGRVPWPRTLASEHPERTLSQCTGLPTHADIFGGRSCPETWSRQERPEDADDEAWDIPWWVGVGLGTAWVVWQLLDRPVEFDSGDLEWTIEGFEIDGVPWTVETLHQPGAPFAARIGEPMLHGGRALPGGWMPDVFIGGKPALTVAHLVAACPMTTSLGAPHVPQSLAWSTTNTSVLVNGELLLRAGDHAIESPGGPNPLSAGAPTVLAGPKADPVMVQEVTHVGLEHFIDGLERVGWTGTTISLKASVRWSLHDAIKGAAATGLIYAGVSSPLIAPLTGWGARALLTSMDKPEIALDVNVDMGSVWAQTRTKTESPLWGTKIEEVLHEWALPSFHDERTAEVDPEHPVPTKKDEKGGWTPKSGDTRIEEDDLGVGPYRRRSRTRDADEPAPESWEE